MRRTVVALVAALLLAACVDQQGDVSPALGGSPPRMPTTANGRHPGVVTRVVDGDTVYGLGSASSTSG